MSRFDTVDLTKLPPPDAVEEIDFEVVLAELVQDFRTRFPDHADLLESDPVMKTLEAWAYRETLFRQRVNEGVRAELLATARGSDLDHIGARYSVARRLLDPGNPDAVPPVPPTYESDDSLRARIQMAPEALSVAGPVGAYVFHATSAHPQVRDVAVQSPTPGDVLVTVLADTGDGTPPADVLDAVRDQLNDDDIRPLTDRVTVQAATILPYQVQATIRIYPGPSADVVRAAAEQAVTAYVEACWRLGRPVPVSGLLAAMHVEGVESVDLVSPAGGMAPAAHEAAWCEGVALTVELVE